MVSEKGIELMLDVIEGAPRLDFFLEDAPYPKEYLKDKPAVETTNLKLRKLKEKGLIDEPRSAVYFSDEPKFPAYFAAPPGAKDLREDQCGGSMALTAEGAKTKAMAECIERYCLRNLHKRIKGSYEELYPNNHLSTCFEVDEKAEYSWTEVFNVKNKTLANIPSQLIYVPENFSDLFDKEPMISVPISSGAAYGDNYALAIQNGLLEIIERDATMLTWLAKRDDIAKINLNTEKTKALDDYFKKYNLELNVFEATADLHAPVMLTILRNKTNIGPAISVGAGASLNPEKAAIKSIMEAHQGRLWIRSSYAVEGQPKIKKNEIIDMKTRAFYWYDENKVANLDFLLKNERRKKLSSIYNLERDTKRSVDLIVSNILGKDYNLFIADVSTPDVKKIGCRVIKAICPELQPLYLNENYPVHSKRLEKYLKGPINTVPHPVM